MPRLEHVVKAMADKKRKEVPNSEILEEIKLVGTAVELRSRIKQMTAVVNSLESRMDQLEEVLTGAVSGIKIPIYDKALDGLKGAINDLKGELAEGLVPMARGIADTHNSVRGIKFPEMPTPEHVDLAPLHDEIAGLMGALSQISISVPGREVVVESAPKEYVFDVKRKRSGLIDRVEVTEK